ncbi:unnamed protein product [Camellia sinensis]
MRSRISCLVYVKAHLLLCITLLHITIVSSVTPPATTTTSSLKNNPTIKCALNENNTDQLALLAFKSKIIEDPQGVLKSWNDSHQFCKWDGVTCSQQSRRVTVIDLSFRGLVGTLSPYIGNLSFLHEIWLGNNTLQGEIPPEIGRLSRLQKLGLNNNSLEGEIPANLSQCYKLTYLRLDVNKLVGKIPKELGSLSKLTKLLIHNNTLTGGIPPFIGNLTSLESLNAAGNVLGGSIPDALGQLKNLKELLLGSNELNGTIPPSIYNLSSLSVFSLLENQLHGNLPQGFFFMLPRLQVLQLRVNQFTGPLPLSLSNASLLEKIDLMNNNFNGKISINFGGLQHIWRVTLGFNNFGSGEPDDLNFVASLVNCSNLEVLSLGGNQFRAAFPNYVGNLSTHLLQLGFSFNHIYGVIPSSISNLANLYNLFLMGNQITGTIPSDIGRISKLQRLHLNSNRLSKKIPNSIGNLSLLSVLRLDNNRLHGTIPSGIKNCQNLLLLNLSHNNLGGNIPKQLFDVPILSISLNLAKNSFHGSLPAEVGNLKNLGELDVSENKLFGKIPSSLGSCISLENLYLEGNIFQGPIPLSLKSLRGIHNFDLSCNNFSGQIPQYLEDFSLKKLNLSFNDFEGMVPMKGVFANASAISVFGNNRLCGGIYELQLPRCAFKESKKQRMSLAVCVKIILAATAVLGVIFVSFFMFCWFMKKGRYQASRSFSRRSLLTVSYKELFKATDGFSSENLIGVGSFGSIYKGILGVDGSVVAVKVLDLCRQGASKSFVAECEALRNIRHRNLVKVITSCSSVDFQGNDFKALVYEYMPNGSLERWLHSRPHIGYGQTDFQSLTLLQRINIALDVACALNYLHCHCQRPIIHCDLKPSNILLDCEMTAHIGDFGLARFLPELMNPNHSSSIGIIGTIGYVPPEYGLGNEVSTEGDIYGYGILLLEMMTGKRPTDSMFGEGLSLHKFARMALPDRVMEVLDPKLLNNDEEEAAVVANNTRKEVCLVSLIQIGVACSMETPRYRMDISDVVHELNLVRDILQATQACP